MPNLTVRSLSLRWAQVLLVAAVAAVAVRNATVYPAIAGYDAQEAFDYARGILAGQLPQGTGSYYTPPGFFAAGAAGFELGDLLGLTHPERVGQMLNALATVGTCVLLLVLVRTLWPGREFLHLAALVFFVASPVVFKAGAMFHPEPLSMLLSTAALVLAARLLVHSDYGLKTAAALGGVLGLAQLVRAWSLLTLAVVLVVLAGMFAARRADRRRIFRSLAVVAVVAMAVPAPWYVHQVTRYQSPLFGQPHPSAPVWSRRPLGFFVDAGLPELITAPYRQSFSQSFIPLAYAETWGDYFGVWRWNPPAGPPRPDVHRQLVLASIVGLPFTLGGIAGWLGLCGLALRHWRRRPELQLVALLPPLALAALLYFATAYPTGDGDTAKGSFMLTAVPAWAACFGFGVDGLRTRFRRLTTPLLFLLGSLTILSLAFSRAVGAR